MKINDFVREESPKGYVSSFYHISGIHICENNRGYTVVSNNEYREIISNKSDKQIEQRIYYSNFDEALEEASEIIKYANARGSLDARYIQRKRGSNYKVNSQDQGHDINSSEAKLVGRIAKVVDYRKQRGSEKSDNTKNNREEKEPMENSQMCYC